MALMVEKMPAVAYAALSQFHVDDRALRRRYYYLNQLESEVNQKDRSRSFAKTALEVRFVFFKERCRVITSSQQLPFLCLQTWFSVKPIRLRDLTKYNGFRTLVQLTQGHN